MSAKSPLVMDNPETSKMNTEIIIISDCEDDDIVFVADIKKESYYESEIIDVESDDPPPSEMRAFKASPSATSHTSDNTENQARYELSAEIVDIESDNPVPIGNKTIKASTASDTSSDNSEEQGRDGRSFCNASDVTSDFDKVAENQASFYSAYDTPSNGGDTPSLTSGYQSGTPSTRSSRFRSLSTDFECSSDDDKMDSMEEADSGPEGHWSKSFRFYQHGSEGVELLENSAPRQGEVVFVKVVSSTGSSSWKRGRIEKCIKETDKAVKYKVKVHSGYTVIVSGACVAYWKPIPRILPVGLKVIASPEYPHQGQNDKFYAGVIRESLSNENKSCYLIYFDHGDVLHVHWNRVRLICHSGKVADDDQSEETDQPAAEHPRKDSENNQKRALTQEDKNAERSLFPPNSVPIDESETSELKYAPSEIKPALSELRSASSEPLFPAMSQTLPRQGSKVFVRVSGSDCWRRGRVEELITNSDKSVKYVVEVHRGDTLVVTSKSLAYWKRPARKKCLTVGTRVIANQERANFDDQFDFYSGVVLEVPKSKNENRCLVFFDGGEAQYVRRKCIRMVCESPQNVWEQVDDEYQDFVRSYIEEDPCNIWDTQPGNKVLAKKKKEWLKAEVVQVDCSTAKIKFQDGRMKWIIRSEKLLSPFVDTPTKVDSSQITNATNNCCAVKSDPDATENSNAICRSSSSVTGGRKSSADPLYILYFVMPPKPKEGNSSSNAISNPIPDKTDNSGSTVSKIISSITRPTAFPLNEAANKTQTPHASSPSIPYSTAANSSAAVPDSTAAINASKPYNNAASTPHPTTTNAICCSTDTIPTPSTTDTPYSNSTACVPYNTTKIHLVTPYSIAPIPPSTPVHRPSNSTPHGDNRTTVTHDTAAISVNRIISIPPAIDVNQVTASPPFVSKQTFIIPPAIAVIKTTTTPPEISIPSANKTTGVDIPYHTTAQDKVVAKVKSSCNISAKAFRHPPPTTPTSPAAVAKRQSYNSKSSASLSSSTESIKSAGGPNHVPQGPIRRSKRGHTFEVRTPDLKKFLSHKCGRRCINWTPFKKQLLYSLNPLAICVNCGWRRDVVTNKGRKVMYTTPCGVVLFNMEEILKYLTTVTSKMTIDLFDFDPDVRLASLIYDKKRILIRDLSFGVEESQILVYNDIDNSKPDRFQYTLSCTRLDGAVAPGVDAEFITCCECKDDCSDRASCWCQQKTMKPYKNDVIGYQYRRLHNRVETEIFECNERCRCSSNCPNRVAQFPLQLRLHVFKTIDKGWGVRCIYDIPKGTFICTFVGEILTQKEAEEENKRNGNEYFVYLKHRKPPKKSKKECKRNKIVESFDDESDRDVEDSPKRVDFGTAVRSTLKRTKKQKKKGKKRSRVSYSNNSWSSLDSASFSEDRPTDIYVLNARYKGNVARFFNYSSMPNMFVQSVLFDQRLHRLAFFASERIRAGNELTWDYGIFPVTSTALD